MIRSFLESWELFGTSYLVGWLIAILLASAGCFLVVRNRIFLGAAIAQASTLGIATGLLLYELWAGHAGLEEHPTARMILLSVLAAAFSIAAVLLAEGRPRRRSIETPESNTGWVFLICASLAILLVAHSPHGTEEIHRVVASDFLVASGTDLILFSVLASGTLLSLLVWHRPLRLYALDPQMASVAGHPVGWLELVSSVWIGLLTGLSLRASGMLYTFGLLVLPCMIARRLCRELGVLLIVTPVVAAAVSIPSFVFAHEWNLPPAQLTVASLCGVLALLRVLAVRPRFVRS